MLRAAETYFESSFLQEDNLSAKDQAYQALERSLADLKEKNLETVRLPLKCLLEEGICLLC